MGVPVPVRMRRVVNSVPGTWGYQMYGPGIKSVDMLQWHLDRLEGAHRKLKLARAAATERPSPAAFVTFTSRWPAVVAATALHTQDETVWRLQAAPNPDEVIWTALHRRLWERRCVVKCALCLDRWSQADLWLLCRHAHSRYLALCSPTDANIAIHQQFAPGDDAGSTGGSDALLYRSCDRTPGTVEGGFAIAFPA